MGTDLFLAGVGGQGTILLVRVLLAAAERAGLPAVASETLGMAQRGGSVSATVRLGEPGARYSPLIARGAAQLLVGLEPGEALRYLDFLSPTGTLLVGTDGVPPAGLNGLQGTYPVAEILAKLREHHVRTHLLPARDLARQAGQVKAQSAVFLGALAGLPDWPLPAETLLGALEELVPAKAREANTMAFGLGRDYRPEG